MNISDFLLARIAEDETDAKAIRDCEWFHGVESDAEAEVLRLADPDRVLADCEAKRRIVEAHRQSQEEPSNEPMWDGGWETALEYTFALLAAVYADHPDYREEWRP